MVESLENQHVAKILHGYLWLGTDDRGHHGDSRGGRHVALRQDNPAIPSTGAAAEATRLTGEAREHMINVFVDLHAFGAKAPTDGEIGGVIADLQEGICDGT
jgi:hypothetical protein